MADFKKRTLQDLCAGQVSASGVAVCTVGNSQRVGHRSGHSPVALEARCRGAIACLGIGSTHLVGGTGVAHTGESDCDCLQLPQHTGSTLAALVALSVFSTVWYHLTCLARQRYRAYNSTYKP